MSNERIAIEITETGARRVKAGLEGIGDGAKEAEGALKLLKSTLGALGVGLFLKNILATADAYTTLTNQVRLVTKGHEQLGVVTERLLQIANSTRGSFEGTAEAYVKVARQADVLGVSQNEVLQFTESLNQAIALSGSTSQQAEAGIRQLGQAIGSGALKGDELNSILENTNEVAQVIAKGMGVTIGQVKALGSAGKITGTVILDAFKKAREELAERFGSTIPTVGQAVTVLENTWTSFIGKLNEGTGITAALSQGIIFVAEHLETLARVLGALAAVITVVLVRQALAALIAKLEVLDLWLAANPYVALTMAILAAAAALAFFADQISVSTDGMVTLADVGVAAWHYIRDGIVALARIVGANFDKFVEWAGETFGNMAENSISFPRAVARGLDNILRLFNAVAYAIIYSFEAVWKQLKAGITFVYDFWKAVLTGQELPKKAALLGAGLAENFQGGFIKGWEAMGSAGLLEKGLDGLLDSARMVANSRLEAQMAADASRAKALSALDQKGTAAAPAASTKFKKSFSSELQEMRNEGLLLLKNTAARQVQNDVIRMEQSLRRGLTQDELKQVAAVSLDNQALQLRSDTLMAISQPLDDYALQMTSLNAIMRDTPALTAAVTEEMSKLEQQMLQSQSGGTFADGYIRQMRIMQLETRNAVSDIGATFATVFGPGGMLSQGIGDAVAQSIVFGDSFDQAIKHVAQSIIANLISALVQVGINMALNAALGNGLQAAAAATSVATAGAVTAAWGPAATLVNAATFGAGAAAGSAALAASLASTKGLAAVSGFASGGYTGNGSTSAVAGVVHGKEYVLNAQATQRIGRSNLDRMNGSGNWNQSHINITAINRDVPGMEFQVNQLSENDVEIIASRTVAREASNVIANDLANPSGRTSRALSTHTTASRKRT
jgi:tape measure domain-containing protein